MQTRFATPDDFTTILALNQEWVDFLSPLDPKRLQMLHAAAALHRVVEADGIVIAFLLVLRDGATYDSVNYQWFAQRYPRFLYVDRVVVSGRARSAGAGRLLYADVFGLALASAVPLIACEFDVEPPNPVSARFHARLGFSEVGRQWVGGGAKCVSMQLAESVPTQMMAGQLEKVGEGAPCHR